MEILNCFVRTRGRRGGKYFLKTQTSIVLDEKSIILFGEEGGEGLDIFLINQTSIVLDENSLFFCAVKTERRGWEIDDLPDVLCIYDIK